MSLIDAEPSIVLQAQTSITEAVVTIQALAKYASSFPYYRYNYAWSYQMQNSVWMTHEDIADFTDYVQCFLILYCAYLGGFNKVPPGQLLTIEEVGQIMQGLSMPLHYAQLLTTDSADQRER